MFLLLRQLNRLIENVTCRSLLRSSGCGFLTNCSPGILHTTCCLESGSLGPWIYKPCGTVCVRLCGGTRFCERPFPNVTERQCRESLNGVRFTSKKSICATS